MDTSAPDLLRLTLAGPASRVPLIEASADLSTWTVLTPLPNALGTNYLFELQTNEPSPAFFRAIQY